MNYELQIWSYTDQTWLKFADVIDLESTFMSYIENDNGQGQLQITINLSGLESADVDLTPWLEKGNDFSMRYRYIKYDPDYQLYSPNSLGVTYPDLLPQ